jgi:hypothetical protein
MKTDIKTVDTILTAAGVDLPVELLARLDIAGYLDQLEHVVGLAAGERQRLGDLLQAANRITSSQLEEALAEQQRDDRPLGEILIEKGLLSEPERDVFLEFQRRQAGTGAVSGKLALGNLLVESGQITRAQLQSALLSLEVSGRRLGEELIEAGHVSRGQVERGLLLQKRLIAYALSVTVGLAPLTTLVPSAEAAQTRAAMAVSAVVIANARMQPAYQATQLKITEADVLRGHVEIPAASRFSVTTNSRSGYRVEFQPQGDFFESVSIAGLGNAVRLGADGGSIVMRGPLAPDLTHELSFRFSLRPGTLPGVYPWPLQMSVHALI